MRRLVLLGIMLALTGCGDGGGNRDDTEARPAERVWIAAMTTGDPPSSALLRSDDGGRTWETAFTGAHLLGAIRFVDAGRGAAVGTGVALVTGDAGAHWSETRAVASDALEDVAFDGAARGLAVGGTLRPDGLDTAPLVLESDDAGAHWQVAALPDSLPEELSIFTSVCFTASGTAIAVGLGFESAIALRRDAAGWSDISDRFPGSLSAVACLGGEGVLASADRMLFHSPDGGMTWTDRSAGLPAEGLFILDLAFADASHGWLAGSRPVSISPRLTLPGPVLLRTADGGRTWVDASPADATERLGLLSAVATSGKGERAVAGGFSESAVEPLLVAAADGDTARLTLPPGFRDADDVTIVPIAGLATPPPP